MREGLPAYETGHHHVQETVTYVDAGAPPVEFYCCRCLTATFDAEWFYPHDCTDPE